MGYTFPIYPPNSPKNEFKTMKKRPGDIILHKCTNNNDHMLYCSWYMARGRCNCYFLILGDFCTFTPLTGWKMKKKNEDEKNTWRCHFTQVYQKIMIICYTVPEIWCMRDVIIFYFGLFFAHLPPNSSKSQIFKDVKEMPRYIIILHMCTKNYD